jgi:hypothetical protein
MKKSQIIMHGKDDRDHIEFYNTMDDKIITVFSQYVTNDEHLCILNHGYEQVEPMYSTGQNSYVKIL